ncbi:MAG: response regulator [Candidatus Limnocylindria bacterium]
MNQLTRSDSSGEQPLLVVVEDDVGTLDLLREVAEEAGWRVAALTRLAPLRSALADRLPDLIILDDDLPDGSGGDMARDLREDRRLQDLPVLVCTAAHPMRQAQIGAWAPVVSKPFDLTEIETFLDAAAGRTSENPFHRAAG